VTRRGAALAPGASRSTPARILQLSSANLAGEDLKILVGSVA
jgi:hypothetical protein